MSAPRTEDQGLCRLSRPNALRCFACNEPGHLQTACPNNSKRGLWTDDVHWDTNVTYEEDVIYDDDGLPTDHVEGDVGPVLVLRHVCLSPVAPEEPWLRQNIFQSTCIIKGKVCRFAIDSGSSRNVISEEATRKLGLKREDHPVPY